MIFPVDRNRNAGGGAWGSLASPGYFQNMKGDFLMETKNTIISNHAFALSSIVNNFMGTVGMLNDNPDENAATIATLNVILESVRSETVLLQGALDNYK